MLRVESARQLTSASGRRTVVRYRVRGFGTPGTMSIVGKSFAEPRRAELLYENLRLLSGSAPASASGRGLRAPSVPQPIAHVPALRLVVYSHRDGVPLSEVTDAATLLEGMRRAGQWLAALHSCPVSLPRSLSVDREMASTHKWAAAIGRAYPEFAARARRLADGWAGGLPVVPSAPIVPLHKDFHPGHVLVGEELHVIDFDEARQGDRAFDLAHFSVYAQLMEGGEAPGALVAAFLEEYAAASGWPQRGTLSAFQAYAWLKVARQWTVAASPFRDGSPARRRAGVDHALEKGVRCLSE
jgi:Ser/Thr protein kinase RdoA (MazF antagonist)